MTLSKGARFAIIYQDAVTKRMETLYAARGACLYALSKAPKVSLEEEIDVERMMEELKEEKMPDTGQGNKNLPAWKSRRVEVDGIGYEANFEDEGGKINLNAVAEDHRDLLQNYLLQAGATDSEADTIVDSVLDWVDSDDFTRANGAESNYYRNLPEPYLAKNGPFDSLEELALIRGVTPSLYDKIRRDITVYGLNPEINVNFASKEVLSSVPGVSIKLAESIISLREKKRGIKSLDELKDLFMHAGIMGGKFEIIRSYLTVEYSQFMTIRVTCLDKKAGRCEYRVVIDNESEEILASYID